MNALKIVAADKKNKKKFSAQSLLLGDSLPLFSKTSKEEIILLYKKNSHTLEKGGAEQTIIILFYYFINLVQFSSKIIIYSTIMGRKYSWGCGGSG